MTSRESPSLCTARSTYPKQIGIAACASCVLIFFSNILDVVPSDIILFPVQTEKGFHCAEDGINKPDSQS